MTDGYLKNYKLQGKVGLHNPVQAHFCYSNFGQIHTDARTLRLI